LVESSCPGRENPTDKPAIGLPVAPTVATTVTPGATVAPGATVDTTVAPGATVAPTVALTVAPGATVAPTVALTVAPGATVAPTVAQCPAQVSCPASCNPASCAELRIRGVKASGVYKIWPKHWPKPFDVFCDMETSGGGWAVIQRRDAFNKHENFNRSWSEYAAGFGDLNKEYWLGNDRISALTNQECVNLRFDMADFEGETRYAEYRGAVVADAQSSYKLSWVATFGSTAGNALSIHMIQAFSTYDRGPGVRCAVAYSGGWWYNTARLNDLSTCHNANPNGLYLQGRQETIKEGIIWSTWLGNYYSLRKMEMKVRPCQYNVSYVAG